jgi:hypothetical protein
MTVRPFTGGTAGSPTMPSPAPLSGFTSLVYAVTVPPLWVPQYWSNLPLQLQGVPPIGGGGTPPPTTGQVWPRRG